MFGLFCFFIFLLHFCHHDVLLTEQINLSLCIPIQPSSVSFDFFTYYMI